MFTENNRDSLIYLTSDRIAEPHGFTTRYGGASTGIFSSLNVGENRGDDRSHVRENYARLGRIFGVGPDGFATTRQVHRADVRIAVEGDRRKVYDPVPYEADGLATNIPDLPLMIYIADCIPVLLCDAKHKVIAAVHCGWRSSVADILGNALEKMSVLGADPGSISAAIGPGIGRDHFEVGKEVVDATEKYLGGAINDLVRKKENGKYLLDLKQANKRRLLQLGLQEDRIDICEECTMCLPDKYWSHRITGGKRGSQCAVIMIKND